MIKLNIFSVFMACMFFCVTVALRASEKFILLTVLYNETHSERMQEYITCLERNLNHPLIRSVHILYDRSKDPSTLFPAFAQGYGGRGREGGGATLLLEYLKAQPVEITYIDDRPTFGDCFNLVNKQYQGKRIILANADIYFNETLAALDGYDFNNVFMALTRWNVSADGTLKIFEQYKSDGSFDDTGSYLSQDVWIFQTPLKAFSNPSFRLGTWACDGYIAYQAYLAGLRVINPCLTVQCCHLHQSGVRHWTPQSIPGAKALILPWVSL